MIYPIPPRTIVGADSLAYWEGFLTDEEIALLLSQPEWNDTQAGYIGGSSEDGIVDKDVRSTQIGWLGMKQELLPVWDKLAKAVAEVNRNFFHFNLTGFYEPMQLGVYRAENKGHYGWHTDASPADKGVPRKLSMALLLSEQGDFEGGEFQVKTNSDEAQTLECRKGRAWFFPAYTLHKVTPVTKGVRKSLVLWVGGPPFK